MLDKALNFLDKAYSVGRYVYVFLEIVKFAKEQLEGFKKSDK